MSSRLGAFSAEKLGERALVEERPFTAAIRVRLAFRIRELSVQYELDVRNPPAAFGMKEFDLAHDDKNKIELVFIINGANFPLEANLNNTLGDAVARALSESGNTSRPASEWQVRDANGVLLETQRKLKDFNFPEHTRLFLSLAVGAGGSCQS